MSIPLSEVSSLKSTGSAKTLAVQHWLLAQSGERVGMVGDWLYFEQLDGTLWCNGSVVSWENAGCSRTVWSRQIYSEFAVSTREDAGLRYAVP